MEIKVNCSSGVVRRIDDLGRVVIPKEIRRKLHIREGDPLEINLSENGIYIEKYSREDGESLYKELMTVLNDKKDDAKIYDCEQVKKINNLKMLLIENKELFLEIK